MSVTFWVSHLDISGNDDNDKQLKNSQLILVTLIVFHLDISGNDDHDLQPENIPYILLYFFEWSGN